MRLLKPVYVALITVIVIFIIGAVSASAADYTFSDYAGNTIECGIGDGIYGNFSCEIGISVYTPDDETPDAVVKLYDTDNNLVSATPLDAYGENYYYDATFEVANEDKEYIIELYLVDENGKQISDVQRWNYKFKKYEVEYGYIFGKGVSTGIRQNVVIGIRDAQGNETEYAIANPIYINNERINTVRLSDEELLAMIDEYSYAQFVTDREGYIRILNFDTTAQTITNVSYDKETSEFDSVLKTDVPVYYTPHETGEMWEHILSENYYYELELYDYAIVVTGFESKNYTEEIITFEISDSINARFSCGISVGLETTNETPDAVVKLYDTDNNLVSATPLDAYGENYYYDATFEVANEDKEYIIELYLVDENGKQISDVQRWNYKFKKYEVEYGYIFGKGVSEGLNQYVVIGIRDTQGNETEHSLSNNILWINGERVWRKGLSYEELLEMINTECYVEYILNSDNKILILNFVDFYEEPYAVSSYNYRDSDLIITSVHIMADKIEKNALVICAFYENGILTDIKMQKAVGEKIHFYTEAKHTDMRFMIWNDLNTLVPVCAQKDIDTFTWN